MARAFVCSTGSTSLVCPYEKAGIKWQLRMTHLRSRKPNAKLSVNGTKPIFARIACPNPSCLCLGSAPS